MMITRQLMSAARLQSANRGVQSVVQLSSHPISSHPMPLIVLGRLCDQIQDQ